MEKTRLHYSIFFVFTVFLTYSCGKDCTEERKELDPIDKTALLPTGTYSYVSANDTMPKLTFVNDTLAVMFYRRGDKTYRLTYKIDTFGTVKINRKELYE
jgi:hypothetical protein